MENRTADYYIEHLNLQPHPEGGWYRETYRATESISAVALPRRFTGGGRQFSTAIYYLLEKGDFSAFHCIKSDECWHWYAGGTLLIHVIETNGNYYYVQLGNNIEKGERFQVVVPAMAWFSAEPAPHSNFALTGCTVSPGFDFSDFVLADNAELLKKFPEHKDLIAHYHR